MHGVKSRRSVARLDITSDARGNRLELDFTDTNRLHLKGLTQREEKSPGAEMRRLAE